MRIQVLLIKKKWRDLQISVPLVKTSNEIFVLQPKAHSPWPAASPGDTRRNACSTACMELILFLISDIRISASKESISKPIVFPSSLFPAYVLSCTNSCSYARYQAFIVHVSVPF
jgi:hypothetical protein